MQKIINAIALGSSSLVSLAVVGATGYVYLNREIYPRNCERKGN